MKNIIIIYHADCSDGFGGAYAAWKKFGDNATYIAGKHHELPLTNLKNKEIYFIDFIYLADALRLLMKNNRRVTAIDHHISAKALAKTTQYYSYALNHSGAVLAWQYFHPQKKVPQLLRYIEDTDLWKFKLPKTKEIFAYQNLFERNFKVWDKMICDFENAKKRQEVVKNGGLILKYEDILIKRLVSNAETVEFVGHKTLAVNSPVLMSQIGHELVKKMPPIGIIWNKKEGKIVVSLRSDGKVNVAKIAERYGGGGHKAAAGFSLDAGKKMPWINYSPKKK
ncbi:MAG: hypothetical protein A2745_02755 [Candidatus Harrisonbacteria bacterium RIFCSPHIGHO2_01_FULL_44_13]|uniref:DHHA1 domain-containing protein n=1 Tax=Candidatus Harrisonbacteria bacterium RIFCSPLOWO2_01_FULL_44_18 TaxID=1798407 RepID=A0A1G1ZN75_9BACT|nr:MAG: hypothetical protein A2745_02755 [Candidatus Harrisonbacteria bacterium RIFCSPHIGHO2_01_FULL_44_13]OGY65991.1 MAG: hypothetical protein A3A16_01220 [Candidatus Harrisonbacteria bacterium RIFCSPLOWO2_01_FULL_44_18]